MNLLTIPGKYTYREDMTPRMQAEVVMENYDEAFAKVRACMGECVRACNFAHVKHFSFSDGAKRGCFGDWLQLWHRKLS
jgi:hypothetical protein